MVKEYYSTGEIAKLIGISERTVKNYCTSGRIQSIKTPITNYRKISYDNLARFLEENNLSLDLLHKDEIMKILICDDEPSIVDLLVITVQNISTEFIIETANDGYDACVKAGTLLPDVIFLDLKMPKTDGFDVCRSIRNNEKTKHAEIIIITGEATEENIQRLNEFKPRHVLGKPLNFNEITNMVNNIISSKKAASR